MWVGQQKVRERVQTKYPHFRPKIFRDSLHRMIDEGELTRLPSKHSTRRKFHYNKTPLAKRLAASQRAAAKLQAKRDAGSKADDVATAEEDEVVEEEEEEMEDGEVEGEQSDDAEEAIV